MLGTWVYIQTSYLQMQLFYQTLLSDQCHLQIQVCWSYFIYIWHQKEYRQWVSIISGLQVGCRLRVLFWKFNMPHSCHKLFLCHKNLKLIFCCCLFVPLTTNLCMIKTNKQSKKKERKKNTLRWYLNMAYDNG